MAFRRFGTFRTPHGWLGIDGEGNIFQRGLKRDEPDNVQVPDNPLQAYRDGNFIRVTAGTIGNKVPTIGGTALSNPAAGFAIPSAGTYYINAECPASTSGMVSFPNGVPVLTLGQPIQDTATSGNVVIAFVTVTDNDGVTEVSIQNFLSGSLWAERIALDPYNAMYYFNAI